MSDHEAKQATPHALLLAELLDSRTPKSEREHAAKREIERLTAERERLRELECAVSNALPGSYYMDPPDGGDVPLGEQVRRMALDARRYRWLRNEANTARKCDPMVCIYPLDEQDLIDGDRLDVAIDAAIGLTRPAEES